MESATLLDVDGDQPGYYHHKHGDEPGKFPQCDGKHDEADELHADGCCRQCKETSTYAHELQRLLQPFENGIALRIHCHVCIFDVVYLKNNGNASDNAMKATQPPMVSMMVFLTS